MEKTYFLLKLKMWFDLCIKKLTRTYVYLFILLLRTAIYKHFVYFNILLNKTQMNKSKSKFKSEWILREKASLIDHLKCFECFYLVD